MLTPAPLAAAPMPGMAATSSASTATVAVFAIAARRASFAPPTISLVTSTSRTPAATNASASPTFWQQMPTAPRSSCAQRDFRALVRLAVRAQRDTRAAHRVGHQVEVALERVEVDDQGGRVYGVDRIAGPGGRRLHDADRNPRTGLGASAGKPAPTSQMDASWHRVGAAAPKAAMRAMFARAHGSYFGAPASAAASWP